MEMSKKSSNKPRISASPFSSSVEREELERALLSSSASATATAAASSASRNDDAIPTVTAVPVVGNSMHQNYAPAMAVATMAHLPPPPPAVAAAASSRGATDRATTARAAEKSECATKSEYGTKSDWSMDVDGVTVRPETPPPAASPPTFASNLPSARHATNSSRLRAANATAAMSSMEEAAGVARAQRVAPKDARTSAVRRGNERAVRQAGRTDEGLTVDEDLYHENRKEAAAVDAEGGEKEEDCLYGNKKQGGKGGYEVNAYDTAEYDTVDYDVKEYKSIYD